MTLGEAARRLHAADPEAFEALLGELEPKPAGVICVSVMERALGYARAIGRVEGNIRACRSAVDLRTH